MQQNQDNNSSTVELAITVRPSKELLENLSTNYIGSPDFEKADIQFYNYCSILQSCGANLSITTDASSLEIDKTAVITDSFAIIANFSESNPAQGNKKAVADILASQRFLKFIAAPGTLDASDVLRAGNQFFIALSDNTNEEGAMQLAFHLSDAGYEPIILNDLNMPAPLSALAVYLGDNKILINEKLSKNINFIAFDQIIVPTNEESATNAVLVNNTLVMGSGYTNTTRELRSKGIRFEEVNISELEKAGLNVRLLSLTGHLMPNTGKITLPASSTTSSSNEGQAAA